MYVDIEVFDHPPPNFLHTNGQELEFRVSGGVFTILPELSVDDERTPEQRRLIDAQLAEGLADVRAGRTFGRLTMPMK